MIAFGIANISIIPMRREKSGRSEMVSQLLFGEVYEVLKIEEPWFYIRLLHDDTLGWIDQKMYREITKKEVKNYLSSSPLFVEEVFSLVTKKGDWTNMLIVAGSVLPFYNARTRKMMVGNEEYFLTASSRKVKVKNTRESLIQYALMYYNVPYLWGGRTPNGIDCSALVQVIYRLVGISLPREVEQQATRGQALSFLEEAQPGDLAFFGDDSGSITHVGILWEQGRIIHASGRVRIDKMDHHGIFNEEMKHYTHALLVIKRMI